MALFAAYVEAMWDDYFEANPNRPAPVIPGWTVLGQFRADDDLDFIQTLRSALRLGQDNCFYGLLLQRGLDPDPAPASVPGIPDIPNSLDFSEGDLLALVRGTGDDKEWLLDACAAPEGMRSTAARPGGLVPEGFHSIYQSMVLVDVDGHDRGPAAHALSDMVSNKGKPLTIIGHSLGAALVAYLAYDVATPPVACAGVTSYMFASPNPGDSAFVSAFKQYVTNYAVIDWSADLVPKVPPWPFVPLLNVASAGGTQSVLMMTAADVAGPGGWAPRDCPTCNHHAACYARMLDPTNSAATAQVQAFGC